MRFKFLSVQRVFYLVHLLSSVWISVTVIMMWYDTINQCFPTGLRSPVVGLGILFEGPKKLIIDKFLLSKSIVWIEMCEPYKWF